MPGREEDSDSDAPEEFTAQQGIQLDEEIRRIQTESKARVVREVKERRRQWAQKLTPRPPRDNGSIQDVAEAETEQESQVNRGMLPDDIVEMLAAREKKVFITDPEEDTAEEKHSSKKKKPKRSGLEPVILKDLPPPQCLQNSLDFLKKRKMQVSRSNAVLDNSNQALRLLSTSVLLSKK